MRSRHVVPAALALLATTVAAMLLVFWRRLVAPRRELRRSGTDASRSSATHARWTDPASRLLHQRHRRQLSADGGGAATSPPDEKGPPDAQTAASGAGELVHRCYEVRLPSSTLDPRALMRTMQQHLAELPPSALADFAKASGDAMHMAVGDEYDITMLGPWNGRVRVSEVDSRSFTLITLEGHPEAGHITFSVLDDLGVSGALRVRIESWARSRDRAVHFTYDTLKIGRQVQTEVWVTFLQRVSTLAGVSETPEVEIVSESLARPPGATDDDAVRRTDGNE